MVPSLQAWSLGNRRRQRGGLFHQRRSAVGSACAAGHYQALSLPARKQVSGTAACSLCTGVGQTGGGGVAASGCVVGQGNGVGQSVGGLGGGTLCNWDSQLLCIRGIAFGSHSKPGMLANDSPAFSCFDGFRKAVGIAAPSRVVALVVMAVRGRCLVDCCKCVRWRDVGADQGLWLARRIMQTQDGACRGF